MHGCIRGVLVAVLMAGAAAVCFAGEKDMPDNTSFQTGAPWSPDLDIGSDEVMVYGVNPSFPDRVKGWREKGYAVSMMTGISWGNYEDYYVTESGLKSDEIQTAKSGRLYMHGNSTTVGYNVPTPAYVEYIKNRIEPAIAEGVRSIYLEEPEYWAETGWSAAFKAEWERFYGEPWMPPDSSVDAQYRASKLKYVLYFDALRDVFRHIKTLGREQGHEIECHVPTHSLNNYAHWRIVSPMSSLMDLAEMDGYIAQVWTGTSRTKNLYRGELRERTFETAFLEYGQMLGMVRPTGRKVWFLADPIEDNPNYSWNNYKLNYECTIVASLLWPEVHRFEVMPWPSRIFRGSYPKVDLDEKSGDREGIPADYATQILTVINALNDMQQEDVRFDCGTQGIGIIVSDTLMFQRAAPHPSDPHLSSFYGLALPLVKNGIPVAPVQLENTLQPGALEPYTVLLLTYEGQKPLKAEYHDALNRWVREGGCLIYVGDGSDPYHRVREWWNDQGQRDALAQDDLFARLGVTRTAHNEPEAIGKGYVRVSSEKPRQLARYSDGAEKVLALVGEMLTLRGESLQTQHFLCLRRGPYVIVSVMEESLSEAPFVLEGTFIDLFDAGLPALTRREMKPDERVLLYDVDWLRKQGVRAKAFAAAARIRDESVEDGLLRFTARGPQGTQARARILLPGPPVSVKTTPVFDVTQNWDEASGTLLVAFDNMAEDQVFEVSF